MCSLCAVGHASGSTAPLQDNNFIMTGSVKGDYDHAALVSADVQQLPPVHNRLCRQLMRLACYTSKFK